MSIHRAKRIRCTLCRPAKKFRTTTAVRKHTWKKHREEILSHVRRAFGEVSR